MDRAVVTVCMGKACVITCVSSSDIFLANVRRQVSLAGGAGGSQGKGVKALGMLCFQHPLCVNAEPR